jgi:beta-lactam-binding protein with PASTA domain
VVAAAAEDAAEDASRGSAYGGELGATAAPKRMVVAERLVPDVRGLSTRAAVRTLHRAGFRVAVTRGGAAQQPAAGTRLKSGSLVRIAGGR